MSFLPPSNERSLSNSFTFINRSVRNVIDQQLSLSALRRRLQWTPVDQSVSLPLDPSSGQYEGKRAAEDNEAEIRSWEE
ncbi:hypothetical protein CEXT_603671 [Caerostris extrusa]|uniref:Uncharacterized protein n=1 Tax=Caerostris extrusa TaxID=172846 RepID=A0AAV4VKT0_CAEEX|nr:hypothetical protein CEXT_603671 [Caerostris extrusa]